MECFLYLIHCTDSDFYKVGISNNPISRLEGLQTSCPHRLDLIATCGFETMAKARQAEMQAHQSLAGSLIHGEWFEFNDTQLRNFKQDMLCNGDL